jgi:hypothetical protein
MALAISANVPEQHVGKALCWDEEGGKRMRKIKRVCGSVHEPDDERGSEFNALDNNLRVLQQPCVAADDLKLDAGQVIARPRVANDDSKDGGCIDIGRWHCHVAQSGKELG